MDPRTERMLEERRAAREAAGPAPTGARRLWRVTIAAWARWRVAAAVIAAIVLACGGAWYALVTVPAREQARQLARHQDLGRQQGLEALARGEDLDACFADAETAFATGWDASCRAIRRRDGCPLPSEQAQAHEARLRDARQQCVTQYSGR